MMNQESFLQLLRSALLAIQEPACYETEQNFQAELLAQLGTRLGDVPIWPGSPAVEEDYHQGAATHGLKDRPDLIIHCPFDRGLFEHRGQGNYVVVELKRRASKQVAESAYAKLDRICMLLDYAMGILINVDSDQVFFSKSDNTTGGRLHGFAVELQGGRVQLLEGHPYQSRR
jgi:hypothetical protein